MLLILGVSFHFLITILLLGDSNALIPSYVTGKKVLIQKDDVSYSFDYLATVAGSGPTHVLLIPPLGVGIGRWYYDRLIKELESSSKVRLVAPDLLGSASASTPVAMRNETVLSDTKLPLLSVDNWSSQIVELMKSFESSKRWCIVSNGGCVPIALAAACQCLQEGIPVSNLVLSSPPSLQGLLRDVDRTKRARAYRRLSGWVGGIFWRYALWREGRFIQKFSEKNLAASAESLGSNWRPMCLTTCKSYPRSKYSTFSFLAGALRCNCKDFLDTLKGKLRVDVIGGIDKRQNSARR